MSFRKKNGILCGMAAAFCFIVAQTAFAKVWWEEKAADSRVDVIESMPSSEAPGKAASASRTNWEEGYIEVMAGATADQRHIVNMAQGYAVAEKTARHLAYEKLAETIGGLNLYGDATYDRELSMDSNLRTVVQARIQNARVMNVTKSQFGDGSIWVEVVLAMNLVGQNSLMQPSLAWYGRQNAAHASPVAPAATAGRGDASPAPVTGLILDARDLKAEPAMLPRIIAEDGEAIYGRGEIESEWIVQFGLMGYQDSLSEAKSLHRVGKNPIVVRAQGVGGKNRSDFIVSRQDADRIKAASRIGGFLKECRVVAVIH